VGLEYVNLQNYILAILGTWQNT